MKANAAFRSRVRSALDNSALGARLRKATDTALARRESLIGQLPDLDALRQKAGEIRRRSISHRRELFAEARKKLAENGIAVHSATDAEEACRIVHSIALRHRASLLVKGKSMVTEEIGLREFLIERDIEVLETDLGEYLVQLRGEPPGHITAPALHLDRQQIGDLLARKLNLPYTDDPARLTAAVRKELREKFLRAEIGVTGANFVVAETGSIVLVENEGNVGLGSTLPPVVVAITGLEKFIPRLADLDPLLRLLPPHGAGQRATAYTSILGGPAPAQEMHLIVLDNGRERLATRRDAEVLACIRCGSCLNICPIFRQVGGHAYGSIYPGPMGLLLAPFLEKNARGHDPNNSLVDACSLCGACGEICPVTIALPELILSARRERNGRERNWQKSAWRLFGWVTTRPEVFRAVGKLLRRLPAPILRLLLPEWAATRHFPERPQRSLRHHLRERSKGES